MLYYHACTQTCQQKTFRTFFIFFFNGFLSKGGIVQKRKCLHVSFTIFKCIIIPVPHQSLKQATHPNSTVCPYLVEYWVAYECIIDHQAFANHCKAHVKRADYARMILPQVRANIENPYMQVVSTISLRTWCRRLVGSSHDALFALISSRWTFSHLRCRGVAPSNSRVIIT